MLRVVTAGLISLAFVPSAYAACEFATSPCRTDSFGNSYRTEEAYGGGYTTYRNSLPYSSTQQTQGGNWRETFRSGGSQTYDYNPYTGEKPNNYGYR